MAKVIPFKGILYSSKSIDDISRVVAPPYDVISGNMQNALYGRHKHNVVRLILAKTGPSDTESDNRYTRARDCLNTWLDKSILKQDPEPAFYIYEQTYLHDGEKKTRVGFIGLMKIEDPRTSRVLPHEYTSLDPKKDRLNLITETKANISPIFSLFEDKDFYVMNVLADAASKRDPFIDIDEDGVNHKLWRVKEKDYIKKIRVFMKSRPIFIADGHHRYEVALAFRNLMKKKGRFKPAFGYVMVYFSNLNQDTITILSTHRVIKNIGKGMKVDSLLSKINKFFEIKKFKNERDLFINLGNSSDIGFGLYFGKNKFFLSVLKDEKILNKLICKGKPIKWKRLPVTVLHELVLNHILKIKENLAEEDNVIYTRDKRYAMELVDRGGYKAAFFLNPASMQQFKDAARSRRRMPHKSTYFYPKLLSGLVMHKF